MKKSLIYIVIVVVVVIVLILIFASRGVEAPTDETAPTVAPAPAEEFVPGEPALGEPVPGEPVPGESVPAEPLLPYPAP